jgi:hypothetical protein
LFTSSSFSNGDSGGPLFKKGDKAEDDELVGTVAWYVDETVESKVSNDLLLTHFLLTSLL